ncbi:hypothetical protein ACP275_14G231700 [Erythranthe tilingii]
MVKGGEGFQGAAAATVHHQKTVYNNRRSPCPLVWVPVIPSWEKEFCKKVGLFEWEDFVEAKKLITGSSSHNKILEWNDEAAKEAFTAAKTRFRAQVNGGDVVTNNPDDDEYTNPDSYIDEIVWDDATYEANPDGTLEFPGGRGESVGDVEEEPNYDEANLNNNEYVPDYYHVRIEDIVPTGWDVDVEEMSRGKVLTGMIVGED